MVSPWKVILATVIIFATGVITGGVLVYKVQRPERQQARPPLFPRPQGPPPELMPTPWFARREFLDRINHQLNLSREQYDRVAKILQDSQERTRRIVGRVGPEIQEELRHVRREIRSELTPEQAQRFEELQHQLRGRPRPPGDNFEPRRGGPPRRDGPPPINPRPETNTP
jgi:hypothetical protein